MKKNKKYSSLAASSSSDIFLLEPDKAPLYTAVKNTKSWASSAANYTWLEDELSPRYSDPDYYDPDDLDSIVGVK